MLVFDPRQLKQARLAAGLSQARLAASLSVTIKTVARWENGRNEPAGSALVKLAGVLDKPAADFYRDDDDEEEAA